MRLIYNCLIVDVENENKNGILINTLNGNICIVNEEEKKSIVKWQEVDEINPRNEQERKLFEELLESGYLVANSDEEDKKVEQILSRSREHHYKLANNKTGVVFVVTYKCNFACPYCYEDAASYNEQKILSEEMVDKIFEIHNNDIAYVSFYGGEPFVPETKNIIEYIVSKAPNAIYTATTNGYYLKEYIDLLKGIKVDNIMVTLDGPMELHNRTRILKNGDGTFEQVESGIVECLKNEVPIKIRMNISEQNVDECMKLRDEFIERFSKEYEMGILMFEMQPIFQLSEDKKDSLKEKLYYQGGKVNGNSMKYNMMTRSVSPIMRAFVSPSKRKFSPRYCNCDAETRRLFYDTEGSIYSCILSLRNKEASVGTFFPEYKMKENSILTRNIESVEECRNCKLKFLCGGGCAYNIMSPNGNALKPNCAAVINEIYHELPRLYKLISES